MPDDLDLGALETDFYARGDEISSRRLEPAEDFADLDAAMPVRGRLHRTTMRVGIAGAGIALIGLLIVTSGRGGEIAPSVVASAAVASPTLVVEPVSDPPPPPPPPPPLAQSVPGDPAPQSRRPAVHRPAKKAKKGAGNLDRARSTKGAKKKSTKARPARTR